MGKYLLVKFLQATGLALVPVGLMYGIFTGNLGIEFKIFILGLIFFGIGWGLEKFFTKET